VRYDGTASNFKITGTWSIGTFQGQFTMTRIIAASGFCITSPNERNVHVRTFGINRMAQAPRKPNNRNTLLDAPGNFLGGLREIVLSALAGITDQGCFSASSYSVSLPSDLFRTFHAFESTSTLNGMAMVHVRWWPFSFQFWGLIVVRAQNYAYEGPSVVRKSVRQASQTCGPA